MNYDPLPPTKGFMTVHIPTPEPQSKDSDDDVHDVIAAAPPPRAAPGPLKIKLSLSKQTPAVNAGWSRSADSSPPPPPLNPPKRLVLSLKPSASAATGTGTGAAISTVVPQLDRCAHDASPEPPIKMTAVEMGGTAVATAASSSTPAPCSVFGGSPPRGPTPMEGYVSAYGAPLSYQQQQPQASSVPGSTVRPNADAFPASPMDRRGTPEPYAPSAAAAGVLWAPSNNNLGSSTINRNPALVPLDPLPLMRVTATIQAKYELHRKLGEGTYGEVYEGFDKSTRAKVAVKKFKVLDHVEGIPTTTIREITILRSLTKQRCENITALRDVIVSANFDELYLVFDFVEHSLYGLLACRVRLNHDDYRCIARQVLLGLVALHREHIVHRDLKLNNILVDSRGCVKLCDFGLAFSTTSHRARVTPSLVSLPYRPPEMLFNRASYNEAVDVWAFGCLLAQLFIGGMPPFMLKGGHPAATELEQLALISQAFDCSPWDLLHPATLKQCHPMWAKDSGADSSTAQQARKTPQGSCLIAHLNGICRERNRPLLPADVAEIIVRALAPDPTDRPTSEQLNQHPWFTLQNPSLEMAQLAKRIREGAGDRFCHNAPRADGGGA